MDNQLLFSNLEATIVILVLIALTGYVSFAYYELKTTRKVDNIRFIDNIVLFNMIWIVISIITVLYMINEYDNSSRIIEHIYTFAAAFMIVIFLSIYKFTKKKSIEPLPIIIITSAATACIFIIFFFHIPASISLNIAIAIYSSISIVFGLYSSINIDKKLNISFIFTICGVSTLILVNNLQEWCGLSFTLILDLALAILLTTGFFTYYCEVFLGIILDKVKSIQLKNMELLNAEIKISDLAYINQITKLKNLHKLEVDIEKLRCKNAYLVMVNLENFKSCANILGYHKGNEVLMDISNYLKSLLNKKDELYSFDSDRFIFIHLGEYSNCLKLITGIMKAFEEIKFCSLEIKLYIGFTETGGCTKSFDTIVTELDLASQAAKDEPSGIIFYESRLYHNFQQKLNQETLLRRAVREKSWDIFFQPKLSMIENKIIGAEALLRMNSEEKITPDIFIPLSEQLGLIQDIGRFVIDKVFNYIKELSYIWKDEFKVAINLSPYQLMDPDFLDFVTDMMEKYSINSDNVIFEITETALIHNITKVKYSILTLTDLGFSFSLDDFGTGYSSLYHFLKLDLHEIKFDKNFTSSLPGDNKNLLVLESITRMVQKMGIKTVIEGVESEEQYKCLSKIGCDSYQGYYYSKPVPFHEFILLLEKSK